MNNNKKQIKRIGIDARFYGPGKGLGRYTKEVVDRILGMDTKNEYVIFLGLDSFDIFNTKNPKVRKKYPDLSLVLVGKEDYFYKRLKTYVKDRDFTNIIFTGYVSDQDLAKIYSKALAYIFSSFGGGFAPPPLEAMNHGVPVLSSNKTCMPEILEDAALYFNPDKESDAIQKIIEIMENKDLREKLKIKGFAQVKKYSWDKCARQTFEIYVRE